VTLEQRIAEWVEKLSAEIYADRRPWYAPDLQDRARELAAAVRQEALEEAAKVCEEMGALSTIQYGDDPKDVKLDDEAVHNGNCIVAAQRIRLLKDHP